VLEDAYTFCSLFASTFTTADFEEEGWVSVLRSWCTLNGEDNLRQASECRPLSPTVGRLHASFGGAPACGVRSFDI
jgi:hypothetical protein